ncbi:MAG: YhjD/YihY/BrkB family envelope integrity protein [Geobacteraceae bacterium]|nr:YhjD/YihY/BrkB family envelope integrity protein [Geobacteraceae bacterium]
MKEPAGQGGGVLASLQERLLSTSLDELRGAKRQLFRFLKVTITVVNNFLEHRGLERASALSYTSILSFVPLFALAFAVLKGLGVQNTLEPLILERLAGGSGEVVDKIISYINNTKMASVGAIGLAALMATVISLLGGIEEAFNHVWGVEETRSVYRKFSDYLSVILSGPLLLLAALSITTSLQSQSVVRWLLKTAYVGDLVLMLFKFLPYLSIWIALVCLYKFMPNTRVKMSSAIVGGVLAGTTWQIAQWGYINFQIGVAKYNAVYGTLSALPVFMVWVYTSWLIVLFGMEVVVAHQQRRTLLLDSGQREISFATCEKTSLLILLTIADSFFREERPWTVERLANERHIPVRIVRRLLAQLVGLGYLVVSEEKRAYFPARELEHIRVSDFISDMKTFGGSYRVRDENVAGSRVREILQQLDECRASTLGDLTVRDLVGSLEESGIAG